MNGIDLLGFSFVVWNTSCLNMNRISMFLRFFSEDFLVCIKLRKSLHEWIEKNPKSLKYVGVILEGDIFHLVHDFICESVY